MRPAFKQTKIYTTKFVLINAIVLFFYFILNFFILQCFLKCKSLTYERFKLNDEKNFTPFFVCYNY
jgi:hypothetical protein